MSLALNSLGLSTICQVGMVFPKLEPAIQHYEALFGRFVVIDGGPMSGASFRGRGGDYHIRLAIGYSGDLEIELIEWVSGETPHREFLEKGRSGLHHVSFRVEHTEDVIARAKPLGYEAIWLHRMDPTIAYAYLERPGDPLILELSERPWDGGNVNLNSDWVRAQR